MKYIPILLLLIGFHYSCSNKNIKVNEAESENQNSYNNQHFVKGAALIGKRPKQNVMEIMTTNLYKFRELYDQQHKIDSTFNASVKVYFVVDGWGNIKEYHLEEADIHDTVFIKGIEEIVRNIQFGPMIDKNDETKVYYPFVFKKK
jgi:hypothetical protein